MTDQAVLPDLSPMQKRALEQVAAGECWRRKSGAWSSTPGAHPVTLLWLLRGGLIRLVDAPHGQPWDEVRLTVLGRECIS